MKNFASRRQTKCWIRPLSQAPLSLLLVLLRGCCRCWASAIPPGTELVLTNGFLDEIFPSIFFQIVSLNEKMHRTLYGSERLSALEWLESGLAGFDRTHGSAHR